MKLLAILIFFVVGHVVYLLLAKTEWRELLVTSLAIIAEALFFYLVVTAAIQA